jgi:hypothetical protein
MEHNKQNPILVVGTLAEALSTLGGVISDFFYPLAPYGFWMFLFLLLIVFLSVILRFISPVNYYLSKNCNGYWYMPIFTALVISALLILGCYFFSKSTDKNGEKGNGFLSSNITEINQLQSSMLNIEKSLNLIADNTSRTAITSEKISVKIDTVKKETSDNPRKELSNLGIVWGHDGFYEALQRNDNYVVSLFIDGGMKFVPYDNYNFTLAGLISTNNNSYKQIKILVDSNSIDLGQLTKKYSRYSFYDLSKTLEVRLKNKNIDFSNTFENMEFSLVNVAIWTKQEELANYLIAHGADYSEYCIAYNKLQSSDNCTLWINPKDEAKDLGVNLKI